MSVQIDMLPAAHGDCVWIEWTTDDRTRRMLIDGGPAFTYKYLLERIVHLPPEDRIFELLIVTHIDADHIDGIVRLLRDAASLGTKFERIWFNSRHQLDQLPDRFEDKLGAVAGEYLQLLIEEYETRNARHVWNAGFDDGIPGGIIRCDPTDRPWMTAQLPGSLTLTVLSPDLERLRALDDHWTAELDRLHISRGSRRHLLGRLEADKRLRPLADELGADLDNPTLTESSHEHERAPLDDELGGGTSPIIEFGTDRSRANGSSIALLAEWTNGPTILLAGDAFAHVLEQSIQRLLLDRGQQRLKLDALKVPHHGSMGNVTDGLLNLLDCRAYLISTNGAQFGHPDPEAIRLLVQHHRPRSRPIFVFNYRSPTTSTFIDSATLNRTCDFHYPVGARLIP